MDKARMSFTAMLALLAFNVATHAATRSTPVTVVNSDAEPIPVVTEDERSARTPFSQGVSVSFGTFRGISTSDRVAGDDFEVPPDHILVLEHISLRATMAIGDDIGYAEVSFTSNGDSDTHYLPVRTDIRALPLTGGNQKVVSQGWPIRLYADPGSDVVLNLNSTVGSPGGSVRYTVSGYLVPDVSPGLGR